jgi:hypothetical protein
MSLEHRDRVAMHVVEHHNDLFSWKKNNNYMYANSNVWCASKKYDNEVYMC